MSKVCLYLHIHQPFRLKEFAIEELGHERNFFLEEADVNKQVFDKVAQKSYWPMLQMLEKLIHTVPGFRVSFSITGIWVEQARLYQPALLDVISSIMRSGRAEILAETYYHSLASLYSPREFKQQVADHVAMVQEVFGYTPTSFRNTELVYSNHIATQVAALGFKGMITEGVDRILQGRSLTQVYYSVGEEHLPILLKHAQLSDDVAFRFSNRSWQWYPLSAETYVQWVEAYGKDELVNLFMDFETFGEHQWADTGIFAFFESFVHQFVAKPWNSFVTPSEVFAQAAFQVRNQESLVVTDGDRQPKVDTGRSSDAVVPPQKTSGKGTEPGYVSPAKVETPPGHLRYDVHVPISWADVDRDLTAWLENAFQQDCIEQLYALESEVYRLGSPSLIADWRRLQTSDHFYYMCTKWSADGDVHAYFSPYKDPFEAYRRYSIVLAEIKHRLWKQGQSSSRHVLAPPHLRVF